MRRVYGEFRNEKDEVLSLYDDVYFQEKIWASAPLGMVSDGFGTSVAVSSDGLTIAVGAPYDDRNRNFAGNQPPDGTTNDQGAVYVYTWEDNEWKEAGFKAGTFGFAGDNFGFNIAVSGNGTRIIIGAYKADYNPPSNPANIDLGAAYIFDKISGIWTESKVYWGSADSEFGRSVAISSDGNTVVIGAPMDSGGKVYVAEYSGGTWPAATANLTVLDPVLVSGDRFGHSVSVSGNGSAIAAGALLGSNYNLGSVYVYSGSGWSTQTYLSGLNSYDYFGYSVSLNNNGTICAIGAYGREINSNPRQGSAYLYNLSGLPSLINEINYTHGEQSDYFGNTISLSENGLSVIAGAYQYDLTTDHNEGSAFIFEYNGGSYILKTNGQLYAPDSQYNDRFGCSVSSAINSSASIIAIGAYNASVDVSRQGAVYIFRNP